MPSEWQVASGVYKIVDGTWHKRCTGPAHDEPTYLPATDKYYHVRKSNGGGHREGELLSRCRLCQNWSRLANPGSEHGYVRASDVRHYYAEAVNRIGLLELANRSGLSYNALTSVLTGKTRFVQKAKFKKVLLELISMRRKNERSINELARWRITRRDSNGAVCSGCGTPQDNYTDGCEICVDRRNQRKRRKNEKDARTTQ